MSLLESRDVEVASNLVPPTANLACCSEPNNSLTRPTFQLNLPPCLIVLSKAVFSPNEGSLKPLTTTSKASELRNVRCGCRR